MDHIDFPQRNMILTKPKELTDKECGSLFVYYSGAEIISCWKLTFWERFKAFFLGKVWLSVLSTNSSPPVKLSINSLV